MKRAMLSPPTVSEGTSCPLDSQGPVQSGQDLASQSCRNGFKDQLTSSWDTSEGCPEKIQPQSLCFAHRMAGSFLDSPPHLLLCNATKRSHIFRSACLPLLQPEAHESVLTWARPPERPSATCRSGLAGSDFTGKTTPQGRPCDEGVHFPKQHP